MSGFRKTKYGIAICPFFTWTSEDIEGQGQYEDDVNLIHCTHPDNQDKYEGNCQVNLCPLIKTDKENEDET